MIARFALALALFALPLHAEPPRPLAWQDLLASPHKIIRFDTLPRRAEPGHILNATLRADDLWIGERLAGQRVIERDGFDRLSGTPATPLAARPGAAGQSLAVAWHRGFGSMALFPLGPDGAHRASGRGEGSAAIVFDTPLAMFGLKLHADYPDPLGLRPPPGLARLRFYDAGGGFLGEQRIRLTTGVLPLAWVSRTPVAAMTIDTTDPGGIALDDIVIQTAPETG